MKSKLNDLYNKSLCCDYDVIILSETWLNDSVYNNEILCSEYNIYRCDRSEKNSSSSNGGGVLIAVRSSHYSNRINHLHFMSIEFICVEAMVFNRQFVFTCSYIPPLS